MTAALALQDFWENRSSDRARHHCDGLGGWVEFVDERLFTHLDVARHPTVMEWGCGRGEMSVKLAQRGMEVHLVDLLESSLQLAELRMLCHDVFPASQTQVERPEEIALPVERVDALVCVAVVQHFPTVDYWRAIAALWRSLEPKTLIIQTRHAKEENRQPEKYEEDYIHSLWLTTDEVLSQFPEYSPVFHHLDTPEDFIWAGHISYEYFVLERDPS